MQASLIHVIVGGALALSFGNVIAPVQASLIHVIVGGALVLTLVSFQQIALSFDEA